MHSVFILLYLMSHLNYKCNEQTRNIIGDLIYILSNIVFTGALCDPISFLLWTNQ